MHIHGFAADGNGAEGCEPERLQINSGSKFMSMELVHWGYELRVVLLFYRQGKLTHNRYIESFNRKFCDECFQVSWFLDLADASQRIEAWRL